MLSEIFISLVILFLLLHYIYFIWEIYRGLNNLSRGRNKTQTYPFVSVIIPFRNESENILISLNSLKKQDYPADCFEVIYVDDNSEDDSVQKLIASDKPFNFRFLSFKENDAPGGFKKRAVDFAINNAKGDIILTTDADCVHNFGWITSIISSFDKNTGMVAGPVEFNGTDLLFSKIQQLEFRGLMLAGAGLIGSGKPVTCSAANLAYRKAVFFEVGGFNDNYNLSSGDDELLMQKIFRTGAYKIKFSISDQSLVTTTANNSLTDFFSQRKRWASKGIFYKDKVLVMRLILIFFFYISILLSLASSFFFPLFAVIFVLAITGKIIPEYLVIKRGEKLIYKNSLLKYFLPAEIFQLIYILIASFMGLFGNLKWKGRVVKR